MPSRVNKILVVDTEVTGLDEEHDRPVEIATVLLSRARSGKSRWQISNPWTALVNPEGQPISFGAMGTHHITEEMVDYAPLLDVAVPKSHVLRDASAVRAAHVAKFDRNHVERVFPKTRWICTYKCARALWKGQDSYSNQALRYARAVNLEPYNFGKDGSAHRALFDAVVTAELLAQMLIEKEPEELIEISCQPVLLETITFGKHKGMLWADAPHGYLQWIVQGGPERTVRGEKTGWKEDVLFTARKHLGLL